MTTNCRVNFIAVESFQVLDDGGGRGFLLEGEFGVSVEVFI
jgi:hypothetical protein